MCKRRFLDIDILGPNCQLSLGQERLGEQHRKNTDSIKNLVLFTSLSLHHRNMIVCFSSQSAVYNDNARPIYSQAVDLVQIV